MKKGRIYPALFLVFTARRRFAYKLLADAKFCFKAGASGKNLQAKFCHSNLNAGTSQPAFTGDDFLFSGKEDTPFTKEVYSLYMTNKRRS